MRWVFELGADRLGQIDTSSKGRVVLANRQDGESMALLVNEEICNRHHKVYRGPVDFSMALEGSHRLFISMLTRRLQSSLATEKQASLVLKMLCDANPATMHEKSVIGLRVAERGRRALG